MELKRGVLSRTQLDIIQDYVNEIADDDDDDNEVFLIFPTQRDDRQTFVNLNDSEDDQDDEDDEDDIPDLVDDFGNVVFSSPPPIIKSYVYIRRDE